MQLGVGQSGRQDIPQNSRDRPWENKKTAPKSPPVIPQRADRRQGKLLRCPQNVQLLKAVADCTLRVPCASLSDHCDKAKSAQSGLGRNWVKSLQAGRGKQPAARSMLLMAQNATKLWQAPASASTHHQAVTNTHIQEQRNHIRAYYWRSFSRSQKMLANPGLQFLQQQVLFPCTRS